MTIINYLQKYTLLLIIKLIKLYQKLFPFLGTQNCCRFSLSCSHYSIKALKKHGLIKGISLTILRLLACQPYIKVPWEKKVHF